jgi:hypothetical protein
MYPMAAITLTIVNQEERFVKLKDTNMLISVIHVEYDHPGVVRYALIASLGTF